jgi:hypothetical protein
MVGTKTQAIYNTLLHARLTLASPGPYRACERALMCAFRAVLA